MISAAPGKRWLASTFCCRYTRNDKGLERARIRGLQYLSNPVDSSSSKLSIHRCPRKGQRSPFSIARAIGSCRRRQACTLFPLCPTFDRILRVTADNKTATTYQHSLSSHWTSMLCNKCVLSRSRATALPGPAGPVPSQPLFSRTYDTDGITRRYQSGA